MDLRFIHLQPKSLTPQMFIEFIISVFQILNTNKEPVVPLTVELEVTQLPALPLAYHCTLLAAFSSAV